MITRHLTIRICALAVGAAMLAMSASAGNRAGAVSGQFLKLPINARSAGMGNAQVSLAQGALSIATNPAGVLNIEGASFGSTYNQWWADITVAFFGAAAKVEGWGTLGAGVTLLTTDEMNVTTPAFPEGTGQKFKASDVAYTITYAKQISELFGLGLSAKFITSNLYNKEVSSNSVAFDIGTLYDIPVLRTRLGISVTNLGKDLRYINEQYSLPTALRFGATTALIQEEMGEENFEFTFLEGTFVVDDAEAAVGAWVTEDYDLIMAHGGQYSGIIENIAPEFPEQAFAFSSDVPLWDYENVFYYEGAAQEGGYVNGYMAASLSQTGVMGVVGPIEISDAKLYVDGFKAGAAAYGEENDREITVNVNYIGSFSDVALATEAAEAHIDNDADVLTGTAQIVVGPIGVAKDNGDVLWFGTQASHVE
ncbi:PorV/PorQ family protein, partial [Sphingobacteriales bacterium CHB3]|nr:PorV/PorQ family protein [Sphingobacteriales bacterium CHB3]